MKKYLVTGGAGFIGSNIVKKLIETGNDVIILDNLSTGNVNNIPDGHELIKSYGKLPEEELDGIFHLGMPSSSPLYKKDRYLVNQVVSDYIKLLEYATDRGLKIVYATTSSLYGNKPTPWKEDMIVGVNDYYTEARYYVERLSNLYFKLKETKSIGLRLFSVYGAGEEYKKKYANLITQMVWSKRDNKEFVIYGDGKQRRDLTYVGDVVEAFILAMNSDIKCSVINIGTEANYSLNELAEMIKVEVKYIDNPISNYVYNTRANIFRARKILDFKPQTVLVEGLEKITRYYNDK